MKKEIQRMQKLSTKGPISTKKEAAGTGTTIKPRSSEFLGPPKALKSPKKYKSTNVQKIEKAVQIQEMKRNAEKIVFHSLKTVWEAIKKEIWKLGSLLKRNRK